MGSRALVPVTAVAALPLVLLVAERRRLQATIARHPAPGRLVDVGGGRRLHVEISGKGRPAVVLDAGLGQPGSSFALVTTQLVDHATVVTYDRAGYGWSDPPPRGPRGSEVLAADLRALLRGAGVQPPYVLVGHSFGGENVRAYQRAWPDEVAGMVLVDSSHELQHQHDTPEGRARFEAQVLAGNRSRGAVALGLGRLTGWLARRKGSEMVAMLDRLREPLPPQVAAAQREFEDSARQTLAILAEADGMLRQQQAATAGPTSLGDLPLAVVTRTVHVPEVPQDVARWDEKQEELLALSTRAKRFAAEGASHMIPIDRPDVIADAVRSVLALV